MTHQTNLLADLEDPPREAVDTVENAETVVVQDIPLYDVLGEAARPVGWSFDCMEVADEAIAAASEADPDRADVFDRAFIALRPRWEIFGGLNPLIVRAHMDELLRRLASGGEDANLVPGTAAEVCCAMMHLSLAAPLKHEHHVVYEVAFIDALGETRARDMFGEEAVRRAQMDRDEQRKAEIYGEVRHQMRDESRAIRT